MPTVAILLLAAGASSRMAPRDKLMELVDGRPLIAVMVQRGVQTGLPCYVSLPDASHPRSAWTQGASPVFVPDASEGMAASIRAGVDALPDNIDAVMILPTDMPDIESQDLLHIAAQFAACDGPILRASTADGIPGHPVLFPRRYFKRLMKLKGDTGARLVLNSEPVEQITLSGQRATTDLNTAQAWANWRG